MSSFDGIDLFGSGPHRSRVGEQGQVVFGSLAAVNAAAPDSYPLGPRELDVIITGRLVASDEAGLWALRDAVVAQLTDPPKKATLVDTTGRSFADMTFYSFEEGFEVDRGRVWSLRYEARFRRFNLF